MISRNIGYKEIYMLGIESSKLVSKNKNSVCVCVCVGKQLDNRVPISCLFDLTEDC